MTLKTQEIVYYLIYLSSAEFLGLLRDYPWHSRSLDSRPLLLIHLALLFLVSSSDLVIFSLLLFFFPLSFLSLKLTRLRSKHMSQKKV